MVRPTHFTEERPDFETYRAHIDANRHPISLLLDGVQDMRNIGSIFRLADAARLERIYIHNLIGEWEVHKVKRTSRSTHEYVPYQQLHSLDDVTALKRTHDLIAVEITNTSIAYTTFEPTRPTILVLGSERRSVSQEVLQLVDACVHIPMYGVKTSMNVAVAAGIVTYDFVEKVRKSSFFS